MRQLKLALPIVPSELLKQQALGFIALVLAVGAAYTCTQLNLVSAAADVDADADDSRPSKAEIDIHIREVAGRHGVPARLVAAIISVESEFNAHAVSRRGAEGLMQLMPATAASLDVQDSFDARDNIDGGVRHLKRLMRRFDNDLPLVIAAYNAGEQAVIAHHGIPPYRETRQYVVRVLKRYDPEAARTVRERFVGPAKAAPASARITRIMFVPPETMSLQAMPAPAASPQGTSEAP